SQIHRQPEFLIRFHRIGAEILKRISADLIDDADATPFLLLIHYRATTLLLDHLHGLVKLAPAVALGRAKDVAGQTLRVDANQRWHVALHLTQEEDDKLLFGG